MDDSRDSVEIRVRYAETDQMGRAHHSHFLVWCELGRTAFMRERGISYGRMEAEGILLPVSRAELEYRRGIGYDRLVRVETRVQAVRSRAVVFGYLISSVEEDAVLARATTELVCTDESGKPRRLPERVRAVLLDQPAP